ncbi:MAG: dihydrofolate reductase [Corynebacterium glucuronolyticum]|nr:dihydrofolate reductase [Mycobacteriaceae bacterium]MDY5834814.1 dihydrofolate reductase [Corynebacterium glucuronolyticum]
MKAIWAQSRDGIIGDGSSMPWHLPEDLRHFKNTTMGEDILMGRKTWESIGSRALPGRINLVLSTREPGDWSAGATVVSSVPDEFDGWLIGGGSLYQSLYPRLSRISVTLVDVLLNGTFHSPVTVPNVASDPAFSHTTAGNWETSAKGSLTHADSPVRYSFHEYTRKA